MNRSARPAKALTALLTVAGDIIRGVFMPMNDDLDNLHFCLTTRVTYRALYSMVIFYDSYEVHKIRRDNNAVSIRPQLLHLVAADHEDLRFVKEHITRQNQQIVIIRVAPTFNDYLTRDSFPPGLKALLFGYYFSEYGSVYNRPLRIGVLPSSLQELELSDDYNCPLEIGVLPNSLTRLSLGVAFNQRLAIGALPNTILELYVSSDYNHPLTVGTLPSSLLYLYFPHNSRFHWQFEPGQLPPSLLSLLLPFDYDQPLGIGALPPSLKKLEFGRMFNQHNGIGVLPPSLTEIIFGGHFNQDIDIGVLPTSLTHISFGEGFTQPLRAEVLPNSLKRLGLSPRYPHIIGAHVSHNILTFSYHAKICTSKACKWKPYRILSDDEYEEMNRDIESPHRMKLITKKLM